MAEEMGISMDRFDVVRRAMALAAHSSDNTPALAGTLCPVFLYNRLYVYLSYFMTSRYVSYSMLLFHVAFISKINSDEIVNGMKKTIEY